MKLKLPISKARFEAVKSGTDCEEWLKINEHNTARLVVKAELTSNGISYSFKPFTINKMSMGYPLRCNLDDVIELEHRGIEVRNGKKELGLDPDQLYFVVLHGKVIETIQQKETK